MTQNKKSAIPYIVYGSCIAVAGTGGGLVYFSRTISNSIKQSTEITKHLFDMVPKNIFSLPDFNFWTHLYSSGSMIHIGSFEQITNYTNDTGTSYKAEFLKYVKEYFDAHPDLQNPEVVKLLTSLNANNKLIDKAIDIKIEKNLENLSRYIGVALMVIGLMCAIGYTIYKCCCNGEKNKALPAQPVVPKNESVPLLVPIKSLETIENPEQTTGLYSDPSEIQSTY